MAAPTQSVTKLKATYKKIQLIAMACALFALCSFALSAWSGFRMIVLLKEQAASASSKTQSTTAALQGKIQILEHQLSEFQNQLINEQNNTKSLRLRISSLESRLAEAQKATSRLAAQNLPQKAEAETLPQTLESAESTPQPDEGKNE